MIPIRDTIASRRKAWTVRVLLMVNLVMFLLELSQGSHLEMFLYRFGVVPAYWTSNLNDPSQWLSLMVTLVTSQFLHGGVMHLGSNMLYLWIFGDNVEDRLGPAKFLLLYLGCGVIAAVVQLVMQPTGSVPMIGASGAIAGLLGTYFVFFPSSRIVTLIPWFLTIEVVQLPAFVFLGFWFLLQWVQGMTTIGQVADVGGIAWWAHIGGFMTGLVLGLVLQPRRRYF